MPVFLRQSSFRLPDNPMAPLLMVGAGTGLAPYRGFLQERKMHLERGTSLKSAEPDPSTAPHGMPCVEHLALRSNFSSFCMPWTSVVCLCISSC